MRKSTFSCYWSFRFLLLWDAYLYPLNIVGFLWNSFLIKGIIYAQLKNCKEKEITSNRITHWVNTINIQLYFPHSVLKHVIVLYSESEGIGDKIFRWVVYNPSSQIPKTGVIQFEKYRALLLKIFGTENGQNIDICFALCRTKADLLLSHFLDSLTQCCA